MYRRDPLTGALRLVAPGRADRLTARVHGCPFCVGNEPATPDTTGSRGRGEHTPTDAPWSARSFANRYPLTTPHEVIVPTPEHLTSWRQLQLPALQQGLSLMLERRAALTQPGRYAHTFINDGTHAGASLSHVHAQIVSVERGAHTDALVAGVRDGATCALCALLLAERSLLVERGMHFSILAHPVPRLAGALLITPNTHDTHPSDEHVTELAELLRRAWAAIDPVADANAWIVADETCGAHWYLELQPRSANLAGVELALGIAVSTAHPEATAAAARERLAMHG